MRPHYHERWNKEPHKFPPSAENDVISRKKQQALDDLRSPIRAMAANLVRVMRGAGKPYLLAQQVLELAFAIELANELSTDRDIWPVFEDVLESALPAWLESSWQDSLEETASVSPQLPASDLPKAESATAGIEIRTILEKLERFSQRTRECAQADRQPSPQEAARRADVVVRRVKELCRANHAGRSSRTKAEETGRLSSAAAMNSQEPEGQEL